LKKSANFILAILPMSILRFDATRSKIKPETEKCASLCQYCT